jgi:hypothetical protein
LVLARLPRWQAVDFSCRRIRSVAWAGVHRNVNSPAKEWFLNKALRIDDDVAEALYSGNRRVPTYTKSQITPLKNNYNGATPDPGYISRWNLTIDELDSGLSISLEIRKSDDSVLRAGSNYTAGLRGRMECDRLVGWFEIR